MKFGYFKHLFSGNYKFIVFILLGGILALLMIFSYRTQINQEVRNYYIDAEIVKNEHNVLTVKVLEFNPQFAKGTYEIKITNKIIISDWETDIKLEQKALNEYKYVTLLYNGQENEMKDNKYLRGVRQIYCNVEDRGLIDN